MEKWEALEVYGDHDGERGKIRVTAKSIYEGKGVKTGSFAFISIVIFEL